MLPGFLMGDPATRTNTFSPTKKTLSFASSPTTIQYQQQYATISGNVVDHSIGQSGQYNSGSGGGGAFGSSASFNRSSMVTSPTTGASTSKLFKYHPTSHETTISAPPTVGLFDSLRDERNQTPTRHTPYQQQQQINAQNTDQSFNNASGFNVSSSRIMSPIQNISFDNSTRGGNKPPYTSFWITVFGFPQSSVPTVLNHFAQCGTIVDKIFPPQNGNWIHLRFSSRMECDKALNYNGKVIANTLMIGVLPCTDSDVVQQDERQENKNPVAIRSLSRATFETSQMATRVDQNVFSPKMNNGIVSKAMDLFFGW